MIGLRLIQRESTMANFEFSADEFVALAQRLDSLGAAIDPRERALLFAVFQMAADNLSARGASQAGLQSGSQSPGSPETVPSDQSGELESRFNLLEVRVRRLEEAAAAEPGQRSLESINERAGDRLAERRATSPIVGLRTEGGGVPKLSDGFLGSFRGGQAARAMVADDVSVGVSVGVMF